MLREAEIAFFALQAMAAVAAAGWNLRRSWRERDWKGVGESLGPLGAGTLFVCVMVGETFSGLKVELMPAREFYLAPGSLLVWLAMPLVSGWWSEWRRCLRRAAERLLLLIRRPAR